ncbi:hypothetical protein HELRODRAFT_169076 [Helobdella robusta]|uniref:G-patch domain-containing protein n=1 Tax=Helobdella robusta TaxID=6412 RepID=T1F1D3_HELRO|nr:hypothetical protein HELRODRAFT_169076 [Helobdella robusta]ESO09134.1 hypothetical protein HELRODRAFT_169076 [Helobdella robusta]
MTSNEKYVLIYDIPKHLHSKFLRRLFVAATESNVFRCFHYRHFSSKYMISKVIQFQNDTNVCFIKLNRADCVTPFISRYSSEPWNSGDGEKLFLKFLKLKLIKSEREATSEEVKTKFVNVDSITEKRLKSIQDLRPPRILINGNVGTPLAHFIDLIQNCKLPPTLLPKLGIKLQNLYKTRKYVSIPWNYECSGNNFLPVQLITNRKRKTKDNFSKANVSENIEDKFLTKNDDEEAEEWERYESIHEDPFKMVPKEKHFEQEMEIVWEKGGPGIVWYTDINYWDQFEENDERETDDWDVNYSELEDDEYKTEKHDNLKEIEEMEPGFSTFKPSQTKKKNKNAFELGHFENFSKKFASKLMKKYGWKRGEGLGPSGKGMSEALHCEGQSGHNKTGFGYRGSKLFDFSTNDSKEISFQKH